ncbi:hypothetical protein, partial [Ochrobactrum sp. P6BSIII]|uniref:hypothetical protein n=1 Tax=Ochrobactrum sp. P6BSIII TaxID=2587041 RepID=UPI001AEDE350
LCHQQTAYLSQFQEPSGETTPSQAFIETQAVYPLLGVPDSYSNDRNWGAKPSDGFETMKRSAWVR